MSINSLSTKSMSMITIQMAENPKSILILAFYIIIRYLVDKYIIIVDTIGVNDYINIILVISLSFILQLLSYLIYIGVIKVDRENLKKSLLEIQPVEMAIPGCIEPTKMITTVKGQYDENCEITSESYVDVDEEDDKQSI